MESQLQLFLSSLAVLGSFFLVLILFPLNKERGNVVLVSGPFHKSSEHHGKDDMHPAISMKEFHVTSRAGAGSCWGQWWSLSDMASEGQDVGNARKDV